MKEIIDKNIKRVMIVEDNEINIMILENMLTSKNYRFRTFLNGEKAIEHAENEMPDIILLDINLPGKNGFEICTEIKKNPKLREIPIVFISALNNVADKIEAFRCGGVDYITKPFNIEEVETRIHTHLKIKYLQDELKYKNKHLEKIVAERTIDLENAYNKLKAVEKIKSEFLQIISHEIRTPFNGLIGSIEMMMEICPINCDYGIDIEKSREMYYDARGRVMRLIEDASLMGELENIGNEIKSVHINIKNLIKELAILLNSKIKVSYSAEKIEIKSNFGLVTYALKMAFRIAECFVNGDVDRVVEIKDFEDGLILIFDLDSIEIDTLQCKKIFEIGSRIRGESAIVGLGMSPVVANKVFKILGGDMQIEKIGEKSGELKIILKSIN